MSDLPSKGEAATAFKDRYATIVDGLKKTKSAYIVIKEVNQASLHSNMICSDMRHVR